MLRASSRALTVSGLRALATLAICSIAVSALDAMEQDTVVPELDSPKHGSALQDKLAWASWAMVKNSDDSSVLHEFQKAYPQMAEPAKIRLMMLSQKKSTAQSSLIEGDTKAEVHDPSEEQKSQWIAKGSYKNWKEEQAKRQKLEIGGAIKPSIVIQQQGNIRGGFAPGVAEISLGIDRYTEKPGTVPLFGWTYNGYSKGMQPESQDIEITPLGTQEFPDQVTITFPPKECQSFLTASHSVHSSASSFKTEHTESGSWNVGASIPLEAVGIPLTIGGKFSRGHSDMESDFNSMSDTSKESLEVSEATMKFAHFFVKDVRSVSTDFVDQVADLEKWYGYMQNTSSMPDDLAKGEAKQSYAARAFDNKVRYFVSMVGTDFMLQGTLGGKMTSTKATTATEHKDKSESTRTHSTTFAGEMSVSVLPQLSTEEKLKSEKNKMEYADAAGIPYTSKLEERGRWPWQKTVTEGKDNKARVEQKAAKVKAEEEKAAKVKAAEEKAAEEKAAKVKAEEERAARGDLEKAEQPQRSNSVPNRKLLQSVSAGGTHEESSSETSTKENESSKEEETAKWHFYGCTPQQDNFAWCESCMAAPVAIEYTLSPISNIIRFVMELPGLADAVEEFIQTQYHSECSAGYTWDRESGNCVKNKNCPKGTIRQPYKVTTDGGEAKEDQYQCVCECISGTNPNEKKNVAMASDSSCDNPPSSSDEKICKGGMVTNCISKDKATDKRPKSSVTWGSHTCPKSQLPPAGSALEPASEYNCADPRCKLDRPCAGDANMNSKCACPQQFNTFQCAEDMSFYSPGNPLCTHSGGKCSQRYPNWWCGEQSKTWKVCHDDGSFYHVDNTKCKGLRQCPSDNSLFDHACPKQGFAVADSAPNQLFFDAPSTRIPSSFCKGCDAGWYSDTENAWSCTKCPEGKWSNPKSDKCDVGKGVLHKQAYPSGSCTAIKFQQEFIYYDRLEAICPANTVMGGFKASADGCQGENDMKYRVNCLTPRTALSPITEPRSSDCQDTTDGTNGLQWLDRQSVMCTGETFLTGFKMPANGCSGYQRKMNFWCAGGLKLGPAHTVETACSIADGQSIAFLDRQDPQCGENEAMTGWSFNHCDGKDRRYKITCREILDVFGS